MMTSQSLPPSSHSFAASEMVKLIGVLLQLKKTKKTKALNEEMTTALRQLQEAFSDTPPRLLAAPPVTQTQQPHFDQKDQPAAKGNCHLAI
ncbi:uncharacterized protein MONOS_13519 [Monocercomonoides exilis]|uniref:uncharacterized protein n=1 Tax=Monocercomonoides exilis TaxID=2049356 RepID=UPI003559DEA0|nr:hypothetical protein MONOS_13519 [Monocercomonoides exilis]|eukprot:MONOS_13519.1-p1 / transcript=MONOS_13519.1 / gene=MONOS_13519 / organism=Monocercomonoides_exilis_PA203 / gene_product=unspecified product / transcript_product=unspecified product / location=Mono_scaffold00839:9672-9944(+) / protein_length=91 / sequence_SO=supercontig / SO=protein_coding / is_pseudo=false